MLGLFLIVLFFALLGGIFVRLGRMGGKPAPSRLLGVLMFALLVWLAFHGQQ